MSRENTARIINNKDTEQILLLEFISEENIATAAFITINGITKTGIIEFVMKSYTEYELRLDLVCMPNETIQGNTRFGTLSMRLLDYDEQYTVTLDKGSGTGGSASVSAYYSTTSMPSITKPTAPTGYTFQGYYTGQNGSGTKYYNADGTSAHNFDFTTSTVNKSKNSAMTLYAYYTPQQYILTLNNQGGTGGNSAPLVYGQAYPNSVSVPMRTGYVFDGYYGIDEHNVINTGNKYYGSTGEKDVSKSGNFIGSSNVTVYARWINSNVAVTVNLDGGTWTDWNGVTQTGTQTYSLLGNVQKAVNSTPTKDGSIFAGWTVNGNATFNNNTKILTLDSTMSDTQTVTLTALWNTPADLVSINNSGDTENDYEDYNKDALTKLYNTDNFVTDPEFGITEEEIGNSPTLTLKVEQITKVSGEGEFGSSIDYKDASGNRRSILIISVYILARLVNYIKIRIV